VLKNPDSSSRIAVALALWDITRKTDVVLPELLRQVKEGNALGRTEAAQALGEIGPPARSAIPALLELRRAVIRTKFRQDVDRAIRRIDPKAARRAGVW
jgi:hypothetical protein